MTKRAKTILFLVCAVLFSLAAPSAVFYSQGYRVDFENKKVVKTGGLYFRVMPEQSDVYLNGRFEKKTSIITSSAYLENLLPKNYDVEIRKGGYHSWEKNLEVKGKEVTEARNIILFPQNPQFAVFSKALPKITASVTSTDEKKIIESDDYEIRIELLEKEEKVFLTRFSEKIGSIFWLNNYYLIFNVGDKIKIAEIDNRDKPNIIDLAEFENPKIFWDGNANKLYVLSGSKVYLLENLLP